MRVDAFLGGRLRIAQPATGYRAGIDAVLLAAAVPAGAGERVLELGCGAGVASLCLGARVPGLVQTGVELQEGYAALARRNAAANGIALEVVTADLCALPDGLRSRAFDHVLANPPYFQRARGSAAADPGREVALGEATPLSLWIEIAARRLLPGGRLTMIQRAERLPDMLAALGHRLGSAEVLPLAPRAGRMAKLVLLRARKGGRAPFRLHAPLVLHDGDRHEVDGDDYTPALTAVLREGRAISWPT
ncbi:tRNA1(Val) A37 N6-methylase TrmN6 [Rhodovulum bhavnagarense]|uniref:tRNA1(Val) A37 N6-methylase TrmN6 n=1 Tax=Rhodovulum bhavnagarense TaxID=992286 RepID=A0A4R2RIB9_9RHOB|nr:methyltransferase [Rhodovulum bhavnagarense]TCP62763.1 tRNA1(Val) A37 N6-methylase TrmN6 [Rhodovulum bhavnagarense]